MDTDDTDTHEGFVDAVERNAYWSIRNPTEAFRLAFGIPGVVLVAVVRITALLAPLIYLGAVTWWARNPWLLLWTPVVVVSTIGGQDRTIFGGLPATASLLLVGLPLAFLYGKAQLLAAWAAPGAWLFSTLLRLLTTNAFFRRLTRDSDAWARVHAAGLIRLG